MKGSPVTVLPRRGPGRPPGRSQGRRRPWPALAEPSPLPPAHPDREAEDREFLPAVLAVVETPPARWKAVLGYAICAALAAALLWSCLTRLGVYAVAPGTIVAAGNAKVIEPRQAGQVKAIRVNNGDRVKAGAVLVELDPTTAVANRTIIVNKLLTARADALRLAAEVKAAGTERIDTHPPLAWPADIPRVLREREESVLEADLTRLAAALSNLAAQRREEESKRDKFAGSIAAEKALIAIVDQHVAMHRELARQGVESQALLLEALVKLADAQYDLTSLEGNLKDAVAAIRVIDSEIVKTRRDFVATAVQQRAAAEQQTDELGEELKKASQTVADMTLRAPIAGTVEASAVTTVGQAVKPGQQLMQIVPDGETLDIRAYVLNRDIGFVRKGQPATIKIDTFPYPRYGTISGTVTAVGTDAIPGTMALRQQINGSLPVAGGRLSDTSAAEQTSDLVFPVTVAPARTALRVNGADSPLLPGMSVVVEITTGEQRAIDYILFPLFRGTEGPAARQP
ncbi:MAG TPA: HlyD family type I secretion periplasmic adaptor subunit [Stellaceae bacterium]|nr:HlyD family type I secretion periplasmic adaptor subunit [Stellaceae bacterium]